jgi:ubiquinone/menaquinone biosynthesis C-methylase UbiE
MSAVTEFYCQHPISAAIILAKVQASRGHLNGLRAEDLFAHDQDHYGALAANDALANAASIGAGSRVADFCAGLGGPARYLAHRYGATVTGIELTPERVVGATELTRRVGLDGQVQIIEGDVRAVPLPDSCMDAVVSQEALLHVPERERALAEAFRLLRPGGRIAFTDWVAHAPLATADAALLWEGMAARAIESLASYEAKLRSVGFRLHSVDDLTAAWGPILAERLKMYIKLREETRAAGTPEGHDAFYRSYILFVRLVQEGAMGGARFCAEKPSS